MVTQRGGLCEMGDNKKKKYIQYFSFSWIFERCNLGTIYEDALKLSKHLHKYTTIPKYIS